MKVYIFMLLLATSHAFHHAVARSRPIVRLFAANSFVWKARQKCWRPDVSDVERISWGKPAKKKGTGSRGVPHRLNQDERFLFDQARKRGYLEVTGSGWRSQRREAPLLNTYRSLCDARGQVSIVLHKEKTGTDELVIDLSPLRLPEKFAEVAQACIEETKLPATTQQMWEEDVSNNDQEIEKDTDDPWESRPIYQLPPYCISWELPRPEAKALGKKLASLFNTVEEKASKSRKPKHVKPGKNRRSGGYGIG